eukprot:TRINITY_DN3594_c0_g1_i1.p1 TRINITY_DN3594_c0_g1~~TRINITY_DN3594_c0_g1_i1.p1  ORF type:complete len:350 (+),score=57.62 TRINITY_DN3594_c0_g1_i1:33-1082(+)
MYRSGFGSSSNQTPNPNQGQVEISNYPFSDTVSCLSWSKNSHHLAASSWDGNIGVWEVDPNSGQANPIGNQTCQSAILGNSWGDNGIVYYAGGDNKGYMWNLQGNNVSQIAQHDKPIKFIKAVPSLNAVATASWDKTVRYWDGNTPNPQMTVTLKDKVWYADVLDELAIFVTAEQRSPVKIYDLRNPSQEFRSLDNPFQKQIRCVTCFPDKSGFGLGSIEGRVSIRYVDQNRDNQQGNRGSFTFKCHRQGNGTNLKVYAVNDIAFNQRGTFATCGGDCGFHFWDKDSRNRLKQFQSCYSPVVAGAFNYDSSLFAYAIGYDWSQGINGKFDPPRNHIYLYKTQPKDIAPK